MLYTANDEKEIVYIESDDYIDGGVYVNGILVFGAEADELTIPVIFRVLREQLGINVKAFSFDDRAYSIEYEEDAGDLPNSLDEMRPFMSEEDLG